MTLKECYRTLGLANTATTEDVKHAYRRRAFELHPDLNPNLADANYLFQLLNEAYVVLMRVLSEKEAKAAAAGGKKEHARRESAPDPAPDAPETPGPEAAGPETPGPEDSGRTAEQKTAAAEAAGTAADSAADAAEARKRRAADTAYAQQEDVLHDILNDQFARRVFEDIYSEVSKQQAAKNNNKPDKPVSLAPPKTRKLNLEWGDRILNLDFTGGLGGMVRNWLRRQIDDELTVQLPKARLFPGARVRLQIRQGFKNELRVLEVILPHDFQTGKAIRLKGLGRKVGKWNGDLYLTIEAQQ